MTSAWTTSPQAWSLMGQAELPPSAVFGETEIDLGPYRSRTVALLRRYARASVEVGRLPSLLGREFFRSRVTAYTMRNFEDVVIFVYDMERAINKLGPLEKKLLAMNVLEEYTQAEIARLLGCTRRWIEFQVPGGDRRDDTHPAGVRIDEADGASGDASENLSRG